MVKGHRGRPDISCRNGQQVINPKNTASRKLDISLDESVGGDGMFGFILGGSRWRQGG